MSRENVELTREIVDAFNRRDLDAFLALMDDDVEVSSRLVPMEGGHHGHEGSRRWWEALLGVFPDFTVEVVELRDLGELTLAVVRNRGHGGDSDAPFEEVLWLVARWRRGRCASWSACQTEAEALEAAGLSE